jgi:hypothetical protein
MRIRLHYNKFKARHGLPWTLHTSKKCYIASHVVFKVPVETEERPDKKTNPRYFLKCDGDIKWTGTKAVIS